MYSRQESAALLTHPGEPFSELRAMDEIDRLLAAIDEVEESEITSEMLAFGPFAVFRSAERLGSQFDLTVINELDEQFPSLDETGLDSEAHSMDFSLGDCVAYDSGPFDLTVFPMPSTNYLDSHNSNAFTKPIAEEMKTATFDLSQALTIKQSIVQHIPAELTLSLRQSPLAIALIDNYRRNVAPLLLPYFHQDNPYSSIYVPKALIGAASILATKADVPRQTQPGNVAIFYALLATSSFHLRGKQDEGSGGQFDSLGRFFRDKAFQYLRQALHNMETRIQADLERGEVVAPSTDPTMGAMLSLVTIDVNSNLSMLIGYQLMNCRSWRAVWESSGYILMARGGDRDKCRGGVCMPCAPFY